MVASGSASSTPGAVKAAIDCPDGYVCIYPEINFGGQPWVRRRGRQREGPALRDP
ncbi:peptidase inhibitor family I36 protein [Streptomyces sp. NPDC056948]|uniref:peptidase inhibitor family I36 protein n=1 Tax=Streptomyces sp. NPDC056948 TaxID=3345975 RepID=UPI00362B1B9A